MNQTFLLFEHQSLPFAWNDTHLRALENIHQRLGTIVLQATTRHGRRVLRAGSHVGMVRLGRDTFQILPKIDYGIDEAGSATRNLLTLLEIAGNIPVRRHDLAPFLQRGRDWFEILTYFFAQELLTVWQNGAYHHYQVVEETAVALKGQWRLAQQLRYPARQHRFDVAYDEFTVDNPLNRVLRYVVELLWRQTADSENRRLLGTLRHWLADVTLLPFMGPQQARPDLISRLNKPYEPLLNLARLFLQTGTLEMSKGRLESFAFVFDMNTLFEAFIINLIQRHQREILPPDWQNCTLHPQARGHTRYLAHTASGENVFKLIPDLALRQGAAYPLLLDTKYKRLTGEGQRLGVTQGDFYQMYAYSQRYRCPRVLLLYPQGERPLRQHFILSDDASVITAATVNLRRDLRGRNGRMALIRELNRIINEEVLNEPAL